MESIQNRITTVVIKAVSELEALTIDEQIAKVEYLLNLNHFFKNYETAIKILKENENSLITPGK